MLDPRTSRWRNLVAVVAVVGLLGAACGDDDEAGAPDTPAQGTATTGAGGAQAKIGGAGIRSNERLIADIFTIDDGIAVFAERPEDEDRTGVTDDEIIIGKHSPITGPLAPIAMGPMDQVWIDEVNAAGGIHGREIVFEDRDSAANPAQATQVVRELVEQEGIFAMFAGQITPAHQAVAPYLVSNGVPDWSPNSSASWVGEPPEQTRFATLSPSAMECWIICEQLFKDHPRGKVAVIYQNDDFGKTVLVPLRKKAQEAGGEVVEISFELASAADLTSQVQQAVSARPDAIYIMSQFPQFASMHATLRNSLGSNIPVYTGPAGSAGFQPGLSDFDGVTSAQWSKGPGDSDDPLIKKVLAKYAQNGLTNVTVAAVALFQFESLVRALQLAGPDLTREGFIEAARIGFDGSWTCSVCYGPMIYGPEDSWGVEVMQLTKWVKATERWERIGQPVSFETSEGKGLRDVLPEAVLPGP